MIKRADYKKPSSGKSGGPCMVNVRLRHVGTSEQPTAREVQKVLQTIADTGDVPDGWEFAAIDWRNPRKASTRWTSGTIEDFAALRSVIFAALNRARISIVRKGDTR